MVLLYLREGGVLYEEGDRDGMLWRNWVVFKDAETLPKDKVP